MKRQEFSIKKRLRSFCYAFSGFRTLLKEEHNAWIEAIATICVVTAGFIFKISVLEWIAAIFAIGLVFSMELLNSSIERIADFVEPDKNDKIKIIKDLSAAGVFVAALTAFIIGLIIFVPKIAVLF
ncbi:MAG: diacylglycerol kinase family protein [Bacteroidales bacterium]|jgi:diacylglycerol kinase|nr:diacylglycerol kinase family protein [Bacteroidales bacterium]